ncbi:cardioactive peptide isoform X1 [Euwallacea fornicatus]|uniref:cardioactive peptide isoform X1 n=2 Tax=Euwallacea fornicatus TaxID=995702 RepID=UPI003390351F
MSALAIIFIVMYSMAIIVVLESEGVFLPKRMSPFINAKEKVVLEPRKRPFCNAFTGCGRKRSNLPAISSDGQEVENAIDSLLELSAEPAVEDLSRQIMSEAKLWEAIQEAKLELKKHHRQLQEAKSNNGETQEVAMNPDRNSANSCLIPPCYSL